MKMIPVLFSLATCLAASGAAYAESPMEGLKFEQQKRQVIEDVKKNCTPAGAVSDDQFANLVLATEENRLRVREATLALERNDAERYGAAVKQVQCPKAE
ncbi:YicS family protein [Pseudocitrobacter vendiensis]|uniref:Uncharacterized protein YicS n=1 Tax=Pseudocitrobacter vendiensis TaxID=2488306 RepID=A0ABM9F5Z4_9ENTR|nr:YicS family protein [Pseudocitrobacter vendiensis]CAH6636203.1 hypothetical protein FBBNIHIM_05165 [Pseudocitrobacter vendiensis]